MQWPTQYQWFPDLTNNAVSEDYSLRPVDWADREQIRHWRNSQLDVLRQVDSLTASDQDAYFTNLVLPQFSQRYPAQFMFTFLHAQELIGYGALVHINWNDLRAEVSFLTPLERHDPEMFRSDWKNYLSLLRPLARNLGLHKLTTETYAFRHNLIPILEEEGFEPEGLLIDHHLVDGVFTNSYVHGLIL